MGVKGIAPFLQKVCPDVIRELPNRFQALKGKTVVLDATLITTRFHFANIPHDRRHILGWHRLLSEIRQNGVGVICVFDGKDRIAAKRLENARRKGLRDLALARSNIEQVRTLRLRNLQNLLPQICPEVSSHPTKLAQVTRDPDAPRLDAGGIDTGHGKRPRREREPVQPPESDTGELFDNSLPLSSRRNAEENEDLQLVKSLKNISVDEPVLSHSGEDVAEHIQSLYDSYNEGFDLQVSEDPLPTEEGFDDVESTEIAVSLTRSQREIADSEGQIWTALSEGQEPPDLVPQVSDLAYRSEMISHSYRRAAELPSEAAYLESKVMIEAMGVPWVESAAGFEAEALASSLVLHGFADYVASEDTDVLVYQAPLLRNVTSQSEPLVLIFGSEIPRRLAISTSSFIDFAVLIGTDFSPRLKGLGPHRALKLIKSYGNLEDALAAAKPMYSSEYLERARIARRIFTTLPPVLKLEELATKSSYDPKLVAEILDEYELTHLAERMDDDKLKPTHTLDQDYFKTTLTSQRFD